MLSPAKCLLQNPSDVARAKECYRALVKVGLEHGWPPYRLGSDYMELIACPAESPSAQVQQLLKKALDENNIIAAGRYQHTQTPATKTPMQAEPLFTGTETTLTTKTLTPQVPLSVETPAFDYAMLFDNNKPEVKKSSKKESEAL